MENVSKASIHLQDLQEKFLEFRALQGICKSYNAEVAEEYAMDAEVYFETLCFNEDAKFNDPVFVPMIQAFKI